MDFAVTMNNFIPTTPRNVWKCQTVQKSSDIPRKLDKSLGTAKLGTQNHISDCGLKMPPRLGLSLFHLKKMDRRCFLPSSCLDGNIPEKRLIMSPWNPICSE